MSASINQKAYLQKYLTGSSGEKKKKKKKVSKGKGFKIIDDDIDLNKLRPLDGDELDILGEGEDAPQIAGIIDERPEEIKKLEQFKTSSKWRVINQDDGFNSKIKIEEIKKDIQEVQKDNELLFGKMFSDSEDEKKDDSDQSPPQKKDSNSDKTNTSKKDQNSYDSDISPPRKSNRDSPNKDSKKSVKNYDSDLSPPRKQEVSNQKTKERRKPSRWGDEKDVTRNRSNSKSPKRSRKRRSQSPVQKSTRSDSDASPPRKSQKHRETEQPSRKKHKSSDSDSSPPRKSRKDQQRKRTPDSDASPPRKRNKSADRTEKYNNRSKIGDRNGTKHGESSRYKRSPETQKPEKHRQSPDSDLSPPRRSKKHSGNTNNRRNDSDSDLSPPRKNKQSTNKDRYKRSSDSPPPTNKKMASKTLEGKMAGLSDAVQLREENAAFRRREEEAFKKMTDEVSGRNAKAVSRKSKRETSEERRKLEDKAQRQKELNEKYKRWGKGLKQVEDQESRVQEFLHEASKPLARHKDDKDLESSLRQAERSGDPMLNYIRDKKRERGELPPEKPKYKGNFPPNRFNIRPGYRWDGVDRSNGYEKKYFEQQSKRRAQEEEAYKWSTEDL